MVTPVNPPSLVILILLSIVASVAISPLAKSSVEPLSKNTLVVVPPVTGLIGVLLKSSSSAVMVGVGSTWIVTSAVSQIVLSRSKQIWYVMV